jgi:hypothetical protein
MPKFDVPRPEKAIKKKKVRARDAVPSWLAQNS